MEGVKINNLVKLYTLILLYEKPQHGYRLIQNIGLHLGKRVSPGEIYPFLGLLEKKGLIVSKRVGKREKRVYSLTLPGKALVRSLLEKFGDIVHAAVESKLKKCAHCGCEIYKGGVRINRRNFCCRSCAKSHSRAKR